MRTCNNCKSTRRPIHRSGFCRKCYHWEQKRKKAKESIKSQLLENPNCRPHLFRIVNPERILKEYKWRESRLQSNNLTASDIESLLKAIAMACRSEFSLFKYSDLNNLNQEAKHIMFTALLDILENVPTRAPLLHTWHKPIKGTYQNGWQHEQATFWAGNDYFDLLYELKRELSQSSNFDI